jgi:hypothetical protein
VQDIRAVGHGRVDGGVDPGDPLPDGDVLDEVQGDDGRSEDGTERRHVPANGVVGQRRDR